MCSASELSRGATKNDAGLVKCLRVKTVKAKQMRAARGSVNGDVSFDQNICNLYHSVCIQQHHPHFPASEPKADKWAFLRL